MTVPPNYPFEEDEILYSSHSTTREFDPTSDSYFALARMPEHEVRDLGGKEHDNSHRLVIATPVKGVISFEVNEHDLEHLMAAFTAMLDDMDRPISLNWLATMSGASEDVFTSSNSDSTPSD